MRGLSKLFVVLAVIECILAIIARAMDDTLLGVGGTGYLRAATVTLLFALVFVVDGLYEAHNKEA